MTDKLITHDEADKAIDHITNFINDIPMSLHGYNNPNSNYWACEQIDTINNYITQQEQFAKDVARFMVLLNIYLTDTQTIEEMHERWALERKLSKVGKEE